MFSIFKKELQQFFSNLTGYVAIILFLAISGIFLFFLPESNLLDYGYANLDKFFTIAPWILLFLVPAITMRIISDEYKGGTFEILKTKPLLSRSIVAGKYMAVLLVLLFVITPTLIYVYTISSLSITNIDAGGIAGSYIGLFLLAATFASISLCCSSFTSNAVVAFLLSGFVCLIAYFGFTALSKLPFFQGNADYYIEMLGLDFHYKSISRGVVDSRDVIYFASIIFLSLLLTTNNINRR
ncbi:MAG: ABC transporter permease subunit [Ferruginibacter sp.]